MRWALAALVALSACGHGKSDGAESDLFAEAPTGEAVVKSSSLGPVKAEVRLRPKEPRVGDTLYLELEVSAPSGVQLELPQLDQALGRFSVIDTASRERDLGKGRFSETRLYQIQILESGPARIPRLRVEVTDRRSGAEAKGQGATKTRELLTDELPFNAKPVLPEDADAALRPGAGRLDISGPPLLSHWWVWALAAIPLLGLAALLFFRLRRRARAAARASAYQRALERLRQLEAAGLPERGEIDAWYVELSYLIRHYLEDRFGVRAPERTTEEFLREARRAPELSAEHQKLLGAFLAGCDRVKFARHEPEEDEQRQALATAVRFVEQTRPREASDAGDGEREAAS